MGAIAGLHLLVDGAVKDPGVFTESCLHELMVQLVLDLNMELIDGPRFKYIELDPTKLDSISFKDEGGISGYCMISTSHISIHVWPLRRAFMMDVFSCAEFDIRTAEETIRKYLNPVSMNTQSISRSPELLGYSKAG
jgi:S-adenosylmethionine decarboxylase